MLSTELSDWRSGLGRWPDYDYGLFAGDTRAQPRHDPPRFVTRWLCQHCERHFWGTDPAPQACPGCTRPLASVGEWDLLSEYAPSWWRDPGSRP
jgi:hypothetical protein